MIYVILQNNTMGGLHSFESNLKIKIMETKSEAIYSGGNGYSYLECMILSRLGELERSIGQSECGVKESIHNQSLAIGEGFCDANKNVSDHSHRNLAAIKDGVCMLDKSILENRFLITEKLDRETDLIKLQMTQFERQLAETTCSIKTEIKDLKCEIKDSERRLHDHLTADKLDEKNNIIDELRHDKRHLTQLSIFSNEMHSIKSMINSLEQKQEVTNKSIIFGNGSNTTKTTTNNA